MQNFKRGKLFEMPFWIQVSAALCQFAFSNVPQEYEPPLGDSFITQYVLHSKGIPLCFGAGS